MREEEVREIVENEVVRAIQEERKRQTITLFDCPNCGHKVAATTIWLETRKRVIPAGSGFPALQFEDIVNGNLCLTCGKKFEQVSPEKCWKEWDEAK